MAQSPVISAKSEGVSLNLWSQSIWSNIRKWQSLLLPLSDFQLKAQQNWGSETEWGVYTDPPAAPAHGMLCITLLGMEKLWKKKTLQWDSQKTCNSIWHRCEEKKSINQLNLLENLLFLTAHIVWQQNSSMFGLSSLSWLYFGTATKLRPRFCCTGEGIKDSKECGRELIILK